MLLDTLLRCGTGGLRGVIAALGGRTTLAEPRRPRAVNEPEGAVPPLRPACARTLILRPVAGRAVSGIRVLAVVDTEGGCGMREIESKAAVEATSIVAGAVMLAVAAEPVGFEIMRAMARRERGSVKEQLIGKV